MRDFHPDDVLNTLSKALRESLPGIFGIECRTNEKPIQADSSFNPCENVIAIIDITGEVTGFVALSADIETLYKIYNINSMNGVSSKEFWLEIISPLKEQLNTITGECLKNILRKYPIITMLVPKVIFGQVSYPKVQCIWKTIETEFGDFHFYFSIDNIKLDIIRILNKFGETEKKNQEVISTMDYLHQNLENAQMHMIIEVGNVIASLEAIEYALISDSEHNEKKFSKDLWNTVKQLSNARDLMNKKVGDSIHELINTKTYYLIIFNIQKYARTVLI